MIKIALRLHVVIKSPVMEYAEQSKDKDVYTKNCCEYVEKQEGLMTEPLACELRYKYRPRKT
jgi:hypothetical protein